jgi:hypothetical protein
MLQGSSSNTRIFCLRFEFVSQYWRAEGWSLADELVGAGAVPARSTLSPVSPDASEKKSPWSSAGLHLLALRQEKILGQGAGARLLGQEAATVLGQGRAPGGWAARAGGCSSREALGAIKKWSNMFVEGDLGEIVTVFLFLD